MTPGGRRVVATLGIGAAIVSATLALVKGDSAIISGTFTYHFDRYRLEKGVRVPDGLRGTNAFTNQLTRQDGVWLVSSMKSTQLEIDPYCPPGYSIPPMSSEPPVLTGPSPTTPDKPPR